MNISLAFKMFFKVLGNREFSGQLSAWLAKPVLSAPKAEKAGPARTDAVELLATLQREGRLIDFLQESLDGYGDAQIGAAVRDIHRDCGKTLNRLFAVAPLLDQAEGANVNLPSDPDPGQWKLTGRVDGNAKAGRLCHHGWKITRYDVPVWTGRDASAWVIAPAEIEIT
ncbi:MAG TPA: DUF2760 domain-containing protein [Kiritimatiellia bacterium]|nr:DUF2760 domain-containing protein [Kiritimatiellia bacterium]